MFDLAVCRQRFIEMWRNLYAIAAMQSVQQWSGLGQVASFRLPPSFSW